MCKLRFDEYFDFLIHYDKLCTPQSTFWKFRTIDKMISYFTFTGEVIKHIEQCAPVNLKPAAASDVPRHTAEAASPPRKRRTLFASYDKHLTQESTTDLTSASARP